MTFPPTDLFTLTSLFTSLAMRGGVIVSTASLSPETIEEARKEKRLVVSDDGFGFVYLPNAPEKSAAPTNEYTDLRVEIWPVKGADDLRPARVRGRLPLPDGRRFSQWGNTEEEARALALQRNPGLDLSQVVSEIRHSERPVPGEVWTHLKTGKDYTIVSGNAVDEKTHKTKVVYTEDPRLSPWIRDVSEFMDGRFVRKETKDGK